MAAPYQITERIEPGVKGGGRRKFYATAVKAERMAMEEVITLIERRSTLNGADIRGVIYALSDVLKEGLREGKNVELGEIGNFRLSLNSNGHESPKEVGAKSIKKVRVLYSPHAAIKDHVNQLVFRKK